jgi:hypothetical protein
VNFDALECLHIVLNYPISFGLDCGLVKFQLEVFWKGLLRDQIIQLKLSGRVGFDGS